MGKVKHYQPEGFSKRLYDSWLYSGVELTELAKRTGVSRSTVYGYIYCGVNPNFSAIAKIAKVLNVSLDYLAFEKQV